MTAVSKYAGAIALDDLEAQVKREFGDTRKKQRSSSASLEQAQVSFSASAAPHSTIFRFSVINLAGFALAGAAWSRGWFDAVFAADRTGLTFAIIAVFVAGLTICATKVWRIGCELIAASQPVPAAGTWAAGYLSTIAGRDSGSRSIVASTLQLRIGDWITVVRHFANSLVLLGLIGTVIGFIIALSGVDPDSVSDVKAISPMVSTLLSGMSVALYTTLAGAGLNLWLMINHRLLAGASARLVATLVERGEADECP